MPIIASGSFVLRLGIGELTGTWTDPTIPAVLDAPGFAALVNGGGLAVQGTETAAVEFFVGDIELAGGNPWDGTYDSTAEIPVSGITPSAATLEATVRPPSPATVIGTADLRLSGAVVDSAPAVGTGDLLSYAFPNIGLTGRPESWVLLTAESMGVDVTTEGPDFFSIGVEGLRIFGTYDLIQSWWLLPDVDACGNPQTSRLVLAAEAPSELYEPFDPEDPDAAPTPTITTVTPNHGTVAGGTTITITGSGFGDDATVDVDGTPATSVVVVSQYEITAETPAHGAGTITVTVTNPDGVTS